jgi:hypothetical protein
MSWWSGKTMSKAFDKIRAGLEDAIAFAEGKADKHKFNAYLPPNPNAG